MSMETQTPPAEAQSLQEPQPMPTRREMTSRVWDIAWPSVTELLLVSLCGIVDMIMVGHLDPLAIAAVGLTNQPKFLIICFFWALNAGTTALVARFRGAGDPGSANKVLRQSLMMTGLMTIVLTAVGLATAWPMLKFMGTSGGETVSAQTFKWGMDYLLIQQGGLVFTVFSMSITAALRGVGNTRASMVLNLVSNVVNVILNRCLIFGFWIFPQWGVAGASLATVMGQMVACGMGFFILFNGKQYIALRKGDSFKPDFPLIKRILNIGLPAMVEQGVMRIGMILYTKTVAGLGDIAFATHQVGFNILNFSFMNGQAFGIAATTLVGQSLGQAREDLAKAYARVSARLGRYVSIAIGLAFFFLGGPIVSLFIGTPNPGSTAAIAGPQMIVLGVSLMRIMALMQPFQSSQLVIAGALRGAGDTRFTSVSTFVGVLIIRPIIAQGLVHALGWGLDGAWWALFLDQMVRFVLIEYRFRSGKWMRVKV